MADRYSVGAMDSGPGDWLKAVRTPMVIVDRG